MVKDPDELKPDEYTDDDEDESDEVIPPVEDEDASA